MGVTNEALPLLPCQKGILYHAMLNDAYPEVYAVQHRVGFPEPIELSKIEHAVQYITLRNEVLRSVLLLDANHELKLQIQPNLNPKIEEIDLSNKNDPGKDLLETTIDNDRKKGIDIFNPPLMRFTVIRHQSGDYLLWTFHHFLLGGDSAIIMKELLEHYYGQPGNKAETLTSYGKYVSELSCISTADANKYWKSLLNGYVNDGIFVHNSMVQAEQLKQQYCDFRVENHLAKKANFIFQNKGVRVNYLIQLVWGILLSNYHNKDDVVFGLVRAFPNDVTANVRGPRYQTFPIRLKIEDQIPITELLKTLSMQNRKMKSFYYSSPSSAVETESSKQFSPLFNTLVEFKTESFEEYFQKIPVLKSHDFSFKIDTDMLFCLEIYQKSNTLEGRLHYDSRVFDMDYARRVIIHFKLLFEQVLYNLDQPISSFSMLTKKELEHNEKVLSVHSTPKERYSDSLITYFNRSLKKVANRPLMKSAARAIDYKTAKKQVIHLSTYLQSCLLPPNSPIAIFLNDRCNQVIATLAVLSVDCYYLPLDPHWPVGRIASILSTCPPAAVIVDSISSGIFESNDNLQNYKLFDFTQVLTKQSISHNNNSLMPTINPMSLAYIIFTSGTTGTPKGVKVSHANVINTINAINERYAITENDAIFALSNFIFDLSVYDIFGMIAVGGTIVFPNKSERSNPQDWIKLINKHKITIWNSTPAQAHLLLSQLRTEKNEIISSVSAQLKLILLSGDKIETSLLKEMQAIFNQSKLICLGGATEGSIWSIFYDGSEFKNNLKQVPYGLPLPGQAIYILDKKKKFCGINIPGEICIAGRGVAQGYCSDNPKEHEKFFFFEEIAQPAYLTGDLGYISSSGEIVITGRIDNQIKLNGYRIELGEIENVINRMPGLRSIVSIQQSAILTAHFIDSEERYTHDEILRFCRHHLPDYMIPTQLIRVDKFPLTKNGKINRSLLPALKSPISQYSVTDYVDKIESKVHDIFTGILKVSYIPPEQSFFDFGIGSLQLTTALISLNSEFSIRLNLGEIFKEATVSRVSKLIKSEMVINRGENQPKKINEIKNKFQLGIWYMSQAKSRSSSYNIPILLKIQGDIDIKILKDSVRRVLSAHHNFLQAFSYSGNGITCRKSRYNFDNFEIPTIDLIGINPIACDMIIKKSANIPFNLAEAPLVRAECFLISKQTTWLLICTHHILFDHPSESILIKELVDVYQRESGHAFGESTSSSSMITPENYIDSYNIHDRNAYVQAISAASSAVIPYDKTQGNDTFSAAGYAYAKLDIDFNAISKIAAETKTTIFSFFLTIWQIYLSKMMKEESYIIGIPVSCQHLDPGKIGMLTNTLPIIFAPKNALPFSDFLLENQKSIIDAMQFQTLPMVDLVDHISPDRRQLNPLFNILFVYVNEKTTYKIQNFSIEKCAVELEQAKFDLTIFIGNEKGRISARVEYNKNLYHAKTIESIISEYSNLISLCINNTNKKVASILSLSEKDKLPSVLVGQNNPDFLQNSVVDIFNDCAKNYGTSLAVSSKSNAYTYSELDEISNKIAAYIIKNFNANLKPIAVCLQRGCMAVATILGIMKSGNIYTPIDIMLPISRLQNIFNTASIQYVIHDEAILKLMDINSLGSEVKSIVSIESILNGFSESDIKALPTRKIKPEDPAYILFTSGTTGQPKKICLPHKTLVNLTFWKNSCDTKNANRIAQFSSLSFDVSLQEIFYALLLGKSLIIIPEETKRDMPKLIDYIDKTRISKLFIPTPLFDVFSSMLILNAKMPGHLNEIIVSGDKLIITRNIRMLCSKYKDQLEISNHYGPSETHVVTSYQLNPYVDISTNAAPPIGRPIANTKISLKDPLGNTVTQGLQGEIFVSSEALSNVKCLPYNYATGDLGRLNSDLQLQFIAREDNQVKISGYRIELGEVTWLLLEHSLVQNCVVSPSSDEPRFLYAFVVLKQTVNSDQAYKILINYLRTHLAHYMMPVLVLVKVIPFFSNGKVNLQKLLATPSIKSSKKTQALIGPQFDGIRELYAQALGISLPDIDGNFFELGGTSLQLLTLIYKIKKTFNCDISPDEFIHHGSIRAIFELIKLKSSVCTDDKKQKVIVEFKRGSTKSLLVLIHPIGGTLFCFKKMLDYFDDDKTVIGIQDPFIFGNDTIDSVEDLAQYYVDTLLKSYGEFDEYILCGASFGSIVAANMGVILQKYNYNMPYLGIFDGWANAPKYIHEETVFNLMSQYEYSRTENELKSLGVPNYDLYLQLRRLRFSQLVRHNIVLPDTSINLFKAADSISYLNAKDAAYYGWDKYTEKKINTFIVPGDHETMFVEPNIHYLTDKLIASFLELKSHVQLLN